MPQLNKNTTPSISSIKIILKFKTCTYFIIKTSKTLTTIFFSLGGTYTYIMYVCMCVFIPHKEPAITVVGVKWVLLHPSFIALHFTTLHLKSHVILKITNKINSHGYCGMVPWLLGEGRVPAMAIVTSALMWDWQNYVGLAKLCGFFIGHIYR